ncbi:MAG: tetratricopeptide repeat protein, partial [Planctomycetes bacterium]|nr:tetratricopeptide repeat protein [Planctomycetota bacterium]
PPLPDRIGPYRIVAERGRGGMGVVYLAEQQEPVARRVALKVLKPGMDSREVLRRFAAERQALALMDSPNIAAIFDAGATGTGRPYFVMEYVPGVPIHEFCDAERLPTEQRIELFVLVCEAVQHAHHKGVIHRDLKPSNVLVWRDGRPVPKVIDFGVAKTVCAPDARGSQHTTSGSLLGTPAYMSPEQAADAMDVDTRTDVYALGVMLYELLSGTLPFDPEKLRASGTELVRILREEQPRHPSSRIGQLGDGALAVAQARSTDPHGLRRRLCGDLDWIVLKAIEKDRDRRYGSAQALADDLRRHLRQEPVAAGPPSRLYRMSRFLRRHREAVAVALLLVLALAAGLVATTTLYVTRENERRAREGAEAQALISTKVNEFLGQALAGDPAAPGQPQRRAAAIEILRAAARSLPADPAVAAEVHETLVALFRTLNALPEAVEQARAAVGLRASLHGEDHLATLDALEQLGNLCLLEGNGDPCREAEQLFARVLAAHTRIGGGLHPSTLRVRDGLAHALAGQGRVREAEASLRETLALAEAHFGPTHETTLFALQRLRELLRIDRQAGAAEALARDYLSRARGLLAEGDHRVLFCHHDLADVLHEQGREADARAELLRVLQRLGPIWGKDWLAPLCLYAAAAVALDCGRPAEAAPPLRIAARQQAVYLGDEHPGTLRSRSALARALLELGELDAAATLAGPVLAVQRQKLGERHEDTLATASVSGRLLLARGESALALATLRQVLQRAREGLPVGSWRIAEAQYHVGVGLLRAGELEAAETELGASLDAMQQALRAPCARTAKVAAALAEVCERRGRHEAAQGWRRHLLDPERVAADALAAQQFLRAAADVCEAAGAAEDGASLRAALPPAGGGGR